jgi:hypothetical protein
VTPKKPPLPEGSKRGRGRPRGSADITKLAGVVQEMARLYREMRSGKTGQPEARTGVWMLAQIRDTLAVAIFEKRLAQLEEDTYSVRDVSRSDAFTVRHLDS